MMDQIKIVPESQNSQLNSSQESRNAFFGFGNILDYAGLST